MSKILEAATTFNEQSKKQAESTTASVKAALLLHEQSLIEALKSNELSLKSAISSHDNQVKAKLKSTLMVSATVWASGLVIAGAITLALTWWSSALALTILEQRQTLAGLEAKTGGAILNITPEGSYLVLKKKADTRIYTTNSGQPALKLTR